MPQNYGKLISTYIECIQHNLHMFNVNPTNLCSRTEIDYQRVLLIFLFIFQIPYNVMRKLIENSYIVEQFKYFHFHKTFFSNFIDRILKDLKKSILTFLKEIDDLNFLLK